MPQEYSSTLKELPLKKLLEIITGWDYIPKWTNNNNTVSIPVTFNTSILDSPFRHYFLGSFRALKEADAPVQYNDFLKKSKDALVLFKKGYTSVSFDFEIKSRLDNQERGIFLLLCDAPYSFQVTMTWPQVFMVICMRPNALFPRTYLHELSHAIIGNNDLTAINYLPFYPEVVQAVVNATECLSVIPYSLTPFLNQCAYTMSSVGALDNELAALVYGSNNYIKKQYLFIIMFRYLLSMLLLLDFYQD